MRYDRSISFPVPAPLTDCKTCHSEVALSRGHSFSFSFPVLLLAAISTHYLLNIDITERIILRLLSFQ